MTNDTTPMRDSNLQQQEPTSKPVNIDDIFKEVTGERGLWQTAILLVICVSLSVPYLFPVFAHVVPRHRCALDKAGEAHLASILVPVGGAGSAKRHLTFDEMARIVGPWFESDAPATANQHHYGCSRYKGYLNMNGTASLNITTEACINGYVYEVSENQYPSTIVAEWDLVCGNSWKNPFSTSIYMLGMLVGSMSGGFLAGKLGRMKVIYLSTILESASGLAVTFVPNLQWYTLTRFFLSVAVTIKVAAITVLMVEMTTAKYRAVFSAGFSFFFQCVYRALHAWIAIHVHNWRYFHLMIMVPAFLGLFTLLWLPESPRWLVSQHKHKAALRTLYKAYKVNAMCKSAPELSFEEFLERTGHSNLPEEPRQTQWRKHFNLSTFCRNVVVGFAAPYQTRDIARRSIAATLLFTGQLFVFFGLLFFTQVVRSSVYYVSMINAATSVPGILLSTLLYSKCRSRKKPMLLLYAISALILLAIGLHTVIAKPESEIPLIVCSNITLVLLGATFNMIFIYTSELFPSSIRSQGLGNATGLGRIGGILCSFVNELDLKVSHGLPVIVYGGVSVLQVLFTLCLPDTDGRDLPDNVKCEMKQADAHVDVDADADADAKAEAEAEAEVESNVELEELAKDGEESPKH
ncbi:unnamed protein product [Rodentolepis nana]|uniref:MFS domain-containing protein n=1 Tax=Rodentolepis nana TaxID=102285 RepID=A0A0R3TD21_RODNA|nr:unnamed protein product [Rodentolepis nana]